MRKSPAYKKRVKNNLRKLSKRVQSLFLIFSLFTGILIAVGYFFIQPFVENSFVFARGGIGQDFNSANKYTLLLLNKNPDHTLEEVNLIVFDKKNKKITDFYFNVDLENFYLNDSLVKIRSSWKENFSQEEYVSYFERNFGLIVDLTMVLEGEKFSFYRNAVLGRMNLIEIYELLKMEDLGRRNTLLMYAFSRSIPDNSSKRINVSSSLQLDRELSSLFLDSAMGLEEKSIAIVNTTGVSGLGKKMSRYVTNMGGRVVSLTSREEEISESVIYYKDYSQSLENLNKILGIKKIEKYNDENVSKYYETVKSDIVVVLGSDFGMKE